MKINEAMELIKKHFGDDVTFKDGKAYQAGGLFDELPLSALGSGDDEIYRAFRVLEGDGKPLSKQLVTACEDGDYDQARELMAGYSPAKMRAAYNAIQILEGYTAYCAAKRGEKTLYSDFLGI